MYGIASEETPPVSSAGNAEQDDAPEQQPRRRGPRIPRPRQQHVPPRVKKRGTESERYGGERHARKLRETSASPRV